MADIESRRAALQRKSPIIAIGLFVLLLLVIAAWMVSNRAQGPKAQSGAEQNAAAPSSSGEGAAKGSGSTLPGKGDTETPEVVVDLGSTSDSASSSAGSASSSAPSSSGSAQGSAPSAPSSAEGTAESSSQKSADSPGNTSEGSTTNRKTENQSEKPGEKKDGDTSKGGPSKDSTDDTVWLPEVPLG